MVLNLNKKTEENTHMSEKKNMISIKQVDETTMKDAVKFINDELPKEMKEFYKLYMNISNKKNLNDTSDEIVAFRAQIDVLKPIMFFISTHSTQARLFLENPTQYADSIKKRVEELEAKTLEITQVLGENFAE